MKNNPDYVYNKNQDKFEENITSEDIFMSMEELCSHCSFKTQRNKINGRSKTCCNGKTYL